MTGKSPEKQMLSALALRSFRASRLRNLVAVLAIVLTAVLFTSVTTIGMGTLKSMTLTLQMQKMSRSDADLHNMTAQQFAQLQTADFVQKAGLRMPVGFLSNTSRVNVELDVMDETQAQLVFAVPTHGQLPQAANQVVTSDLALRDLGVEPRLGAQFTIEFTARDMEYSLPVVLSGWYEAINEQVSYLYAGPAFRDAHPELFRYTFDQDGSLAGTYWSDILVKDTRNLQQKLDDFSRSVGGDPADMQAPNYLPGVVNTMTNPTRSLGLLAAMAAFAALFVFCGYLLIYNVFDIAVMQDIRRYGLYRTVGMSRRQVKRLINRQALWLSCAGIPLGLLVGFFVGRGALPVIMRLFASEYSSIGVDVSPSPVIFLAAAALTAFTVFLSTRKPVRMAANIPPIEAFRYVEAGAGKRTAKKSAAGASLPRLAFSNLGRNKRRTAFIMISLLLCVVLLNCVGTAAASVDVEKQVAQMIRTDFAVLNAQSMNNLTGFTLREQGLSEKTLTMLAAVPGAIEGAPVYKNTLEDMDVTYEFGVEYSRIEPDVDNGRLIGFTEGGLTVGLGADERPTCNVYGMEEAAIARMNILEGETDPHVLYEKMQRGEGVLVGIPAQMGTAVYNEMYAELQPHLQVGDLITVYKNGTERMQLPILAKAAMNGDDEEIGYVVVGAQKVGMDGPGLYLPASVFKGLYEQPAVYKYSFNVLPGQSGAVTEFLNDYIENVDSSIHFLSAASARATAEGTRSMIRFVGGLVGVIFGIAGVLNLVNTLITSILTRRREFATMQSIGMTRRQLTGMMVFEGLYYALGAAVAGLVCAALANISLVRTVCAGMWNFTFHFTLTPALLVCAVLLVLAALVPVFALKGFHRGSIVEQLGMAE